MFGLAVAEPEPDTGPKSFGVLAENLEAVLWFLRMQTQWRVGMNGPVGMEYGVFLLWAKEEGVKRRDRVWLLDDLRLMEREYLSVVNGG